MIAELRRVHRCASVALAVAVPVILTAALAVRPDDPVNASLPVDTYTSEILVTHPLFWSRPDIRAELVVATDGSAAISIDVPSLAVEPSVLVYWLETDETSEPPAAGRLLGAVRGSGIQRIVLPADAAIRGGTVALFSLGHDEVVASAAIAGSGGQS